MALLANVLESNWTRKNINKPSKKSMNNRNDYKIFGCLRQTCLSRGVARAMLELAGGHYEDNPMFFYEELLMRPYSLSSYHCVVDGDWGILIAISICCWTTEQLSTPSLLILYCLCWYFFLVQSIQRTWSDSDTASQDMVPCLYLPIEPYLDRSTTSPLGKAKWHSWRWCVYEPQLDGAIRQTSKMKIYWGDQLGVWYMSFIVIRRNLGEISFMITMAAGVILRDVWCTLEKTEVTTVLTGMRRFLMMFFFSFFARFPITNTKSKLID